MESVDCNGYGMVHGASARVEQACTLLVWMVIKKQSVLLTSPPPESLYLAGPMTPGRILGQHAPPIAPNRWRSRLRLTCHAIGTAACHSETVPSSNA